MSKNPIRKIIISIICLCGTVSLSGCSTGLSTMAKTDLPNAIQARAQANIDIAQEFYDIGALSEKQYNAIVKDIQKQADKYTTENDMEDMLGQVSDAVSKIQLAYTDGDNAYPDHVQYTEDENAADPQWINCYWLSRGTNSQGEEVSLGDKAGYFSKDATEANDRITPYKMGIGKYDLSNFIMSNYLLKNTFKNTKFEGNSHTDADAMATSGELKERQDEVKPIVLIDENYIEQLNNIVKAELYVLKPEVLSEQGTNSLDELVALMQEVKEKKTDEKKSDYLAKYFMQAIDNTTGEKIYILNDDKFNIVGESQPHNGDKSGPGWDLVISQYNLEQCLHVRFQEFNSEALAPLRDALGTEFGKVYLVPDKESSWKAYLMVYPIEVIDSMSLCTRTDSWAKDSGGYEKVEVGLKKSGLGINLMTGQFVKYKKDGNSFDYNDAQEIDIQSGEYYLNIGGEKDNLSSLVIKGITKDIEVKDSSDKIYTIDSGRIILRDYLEATYAPNYNEEGSLVAFGRKIRFNMNNSNFYEDTNDKIEMSGDTKYQQVLVYERGTQVASFVDKNGEEIPSSPKLEITDFCDYKTLMNKDPNKCLIQRMPYKNEESFTNKREVTSDVPDTTELSVTNETVKIHPVTWFPSPDIGQVDYNNDTKQKQRFYCIATIKGIFGSALFSSWIESTVPDANLDWWNEYLSENGFSYKVSHVDIMQYLSDNYKYQLNQNGIVILDLETIETIQEMYDDEADQKRVGVIRTAFVMIGWALVVGSFLLLLLWVIDTNTDVGLGLLEKVTFSNWVAVKYEEDIPAHNVNDQKYMTFKRIMIRVMIIIAIGILLIRIDVFYILTIIVDMFGQLASQAEKIIKGRM